MRVSSHDFQPSRRRWLRHALAGLTTGLVTGFATGTERSLTPAQTRGPFYPVSLPPDHDNDLTRIDGRNGSAGGIPLALSGRVLDERGRRCEGLRIEIWQCDVFGRYHHPSDHRDAPLDPHFQGYGETLTDSLGRYGFRTIKPVAYPGRTPHIHFQISGGGVEPLVTQMYVAGENQNQSDRVLAQIADPALRASLIVPLASHASEAGLIGVFDIVLAADGRFALGEPFPPRTRVIYN